MHLHARRTARTLAGLTGAALLLGVVSGTPATAAPDRAGDREVPEIGLTWSELQGLAARSEAAGPGDSSGDSVRSAARKELVRDPIGDVDRPFAADPAPSRTERIGREHADLTQLTYRTPARADGTMTITARWADYRDARRKGTRRQFLLTFFGAARGGQYVAFVGNRKDVVYVYDLSEESMQDGRVRPESVDVQRTFGPRGTIRVTMSTEFVSTSVLRFGSFGLAGGDGGGVDETRPSRRLDVGPVRR